MMPKQNASGNKQRGVAAVEFALIAVLFFSILFGIIEFGRVLFTWNAAVEATRYGARTAVVCDIGDDAVLSNMQQIMPQLTSNNVAVRYARHDGIPCSVGTCELVNVSVQNLSITPVIPLLNLTLPVPGFETSLMRESLTSASNPVCS